MATQDILTFLINAIAFSFTALLITEFIVGLMPISTTSSNQLLPADISKIFEVESECEESSILSDPWFLPIDNEVQKIVSPTVSALQFQIPLLLLPPAKEVVSSVATNTETTLDQLLVSANLDALPLRKARTIANALGITQKVGKKDKPLSALRSEIKMKFNQPQLLLRDQVSAVRQLIAS